MKDDLDNFYLFYREPVKSTLLVLRDIILEHDSNISETVKYGMPCFMYKKNILCYLWTDKKSGDPYILMAEGRRLNHPKLEQGDRTRMKILRIDPRADISVGIISTILDQGLELYKKGIVKLK